MSWDGWRRECFIRKTLKRLGRQRVLEILQPGNVWVVERAVTEAEKHVAEALRTCHLRGWVEVVSDAVPQAQLGPGGQLPRVDSPHGVAPIYRLTGEGWNEIRRTHTWVLLTFAAALASLIATLIGLWLMLRAT